MKCGYLRNYEAVGREQQRQNIHDRKLNSKIHHRSIENEFEGGVEREEIK